MAIIIDDGLLLSNIKVGQELSYAQIEKAAENMDENIEFDDLGETVIGQNFIVCQCEYGDKTASFLLVGANADQYFYKCVYSDYQTPTH